MSMIKTITETVEKVKEEICDNYCKYPLLCGQHPEEEEFAEWLNKVCQECPMNKL